MFEDLSIKLETALKKVRGQGKLTEKNISDSLREIRRVLLDADVNYKVAKEFIEKVSEKALGKEVISERSVFGMKVQEQFDLSSYPEGIYFIKITVGDRSIVRKINVVRK